MKKLYFLLCTVLVCVFVVTKSYGQPSGPVTFNLSNATVENVNYAYQTVDGHKLKISSDRTKLVVSNDAATTLNGSTHVTSDPAAGTTETALRFAVDGFSFRLTSMLLRLKGAGWIGILAYSRGQLVISKNFQPTDNLVFTFSDFANYQITDLVIHKSEGFAVSVDDIKLDRITDIVDPTVRSLTSTTPNGVYKVGDEVSIQVDFSEKVNVTGVPTLILETGSTDRTAEYVSGSGTSTLNFKYTVQSGDESRYSLDVNAMQFNGGTIKDPTGNNANLDLRYIGNENTLAWNRAIVIDGIAPKVASVSSSNDNRSYGIGEIITINVNFTEKVNVIGVPQLKLETGAVDRTISYKSGTGTSTLQFDYTVQTGDVSADLDYVSTNALVLNSGVSIKDLAGNQGQFDLPTPGAANSLAANKDIAIDGIAPTVASVTSTAENKTYKIGDVIDIQVNFSEKVWITGTPQLSLETGATDRQVNYFAGTGTTTLTFRYTVQAGDRSNDLNYVSTSALSFNSGTIKDASGNTAVLNLPTLNSANSLASNKDIVIDGVRPTVVSVNSSSTDKTYKRDDVIDIQVNFSESVTVVGTPQLTLETGTTDRVVTYSSGSGTSTLNFKYTVQLYDASADLDYVDANSLSLNAAQIKDAVGNDAILTLPTPGAANSLSANKAIVVDGAPARVAYVRSSSQNRSYRIGDLIYIWVYFSENVTITGTPQLTLKTGATNGVVNYAEGSGTSSIRFDYRVQLGDYTDDLDYVDANSLSLNGGTIKDAKGYDVVLTLAEPGAVGSLGNNNNIVVAQIKPNANGVLFVNNQTFDYTENGTTWTTAIRELSNALKLAKTRPDIKQIWVRTGTYYPKYSPADNNFGNDAGRDNAFLILKNVSVYGGFNGSENAINQRNGSSRTTLSGDIGIVGNHTDNAYHVVVFSEDAGTATLDGFTITGGNANGAGDIIVNTKAVARAAAGGVYLQTSSPILANLNIDANLTTGTGGGIYNISSSPILTNVTVNNNTAANGAGIYNMGTSSPKLTNVNLSGNSATVDGGAIYNANTAASLLTNTIIRGNKAGGSGGGIYNVGSSATVLTNVTISGNWAIANGGALYHTNSSPKIYNSILFGNSSGIYNTASSSPTFYNSIIQGSGGSASWINATGVNGGSNLDVDPKFNGASSHTTAPFTGGDYNLKPSSSAIDAGSNSFYTGLTSASTDLNGRPRVYNFESSGVIDMGAFEYNNAYRTNVDNVLFVKKGSTGNGSSWSSAMGELADALKIARTVPDIEQIWVAKGTYYPMYSPADNNFGNNAGRNNAFLLPKDVKIYGGFEGTETATMQRDTIGWSHKSILSGDIGTLGNNGDNAYHVVISIGDVGKTLLNGFTITGGNAGGGAEQFLTIKTKLVRSTFYGGILMDSSSPTLSNLMVTANAAEIGGGGIAIVSGAMPTITNTIINGNSANSSGGGLYINGTKPVFTNVVISGNYAGYAGGGIYFNIASEAVFKNVTISGNRAGNTGGALRIEAAGSTVPLFYNSIIYGNHTGVTSPRYDIGAKYHNSILQGSRGSGNWLITVGTNGGNNLDIDPQFLSAPSGDTAPFADGDYQLQSTSPAINKGNNSYYTGLAEATKDLAGKPRVSDQEDGALIDMGAYEYQTPIAPNADGVLFVKKGSTGKGASWTKAVGELADALKEAKTNTNIKQIWVAAGTYQPLYSPADNNFGVNADRGNAFLLVKDVKIYGGFVGTESTLSQRNFNNNVTTLSGNLGGSGNSYNVVVSSGSMGTATLDGFTIRDGNASNSSYFYANGNQVYPCSGAGIYNSVTDADYKNLIVMNNVCGESGGGMFSYKSSVKLNHVTMKNNSARHGGAMANQDNSNATVINSLFIGNSSSDGGDAIYNVDGSLPTFINITVAQNTGSATNGILNENNALPEIYNSIVWGRITGNYQGRNSIIQHSADATNGNIDASNLNNTDIFTNPVSNDFSIKNGSPTINKGNNTYYTGLSGTTTDLAGNPRVFNFATHGTIDLGAYEYQGTLSQTINFVALDQKNTNSEDFTLTATATSGLAVSYTSSNTAIAAVYEDNGVWKVKIKGVGTVEITAMQGGNGNYAAAADSKQTLVVVDVLPVELISYTAKVWNQSTRLDWNIASETDNRKFVVYRSGDDGKFLPIGEVVSLGNTNANRSYFFVDRQPLNGNNYYKLLQVDLDGKTKELGIRSVSFSLTAVSAQLYPNPTKDKATLTFEAAKYSRFLLSTLDGRLLKTVDLNATQDRLEVDLSAYPTGLYFVRLMGLGQSTVRKIMKQ